ncbi:MAG TPA: extracellular solute-binding protein [Trueperaceae bacterium]
MNIRRIRAIIAGLVLVCAGSALAQPEWAKGVDRLVWGNAGSIDGDPAILETILEFEAWTGIDVEIVPVPDLSQTTEWARTLALGEGTYDVIDVLVGLGNPEWARNGWIVPLDDVVPEGLRQDWLPSAVEAGTYDGELYWMPHYGQTLMLGYRSDLLEEAGFDGPPQTWDELLEVAQALTIDENGDGNPETFGFAFPTLGDYGLWTFKSFLKGGGGQMWNEDGTPAFLGEEGLQALEFLDGLMESGSVPEGVTEYTAGDAGEVLSGGQAAMALLSTGGVIDATRQSTPYGQYLEVAPLPTIRPASEMDNEFVYNASYNGVVVNADSPNIEAAKQLALFMGTYASSWNEGAVEGNIPVVRSTYESPYLQKHFSYADAILEQFNRANSDIHQGYAAYLEPVNQALQNVLNGQMEPQEALDWLDDRLQELEVY